MHGPCIALEKLLSDLILISSSWLYHVGVNIFVLLQSPLVIFYILHGRFWGRS